MNQFVAIADINTALLTRALPTVTLWNRLEPRPRTNNLDRALKAEIRDALWMLSKQWQLGEFMGDDAGSPVFSKIHMGITHITQYAAAGNAPQPFHDEVPLEAKVEQRAIAFTMGGQKIALDIRLQMGRYWLKLISGIGDFKNDFIARYSISAPDATSPTDAHVTAHPESWQQFNAAANRCMDGAELYFYLQNTTGSHAYDGIAAVPDDKKAAIDAAANKFILWYQRMYLQPTDPQNNAWKPGQLEYQFSCAAPVEGQEKRMVADEYYHGHLDWYNLDIDPTVSTAPSNTPPPPPADVEVPITRSFIPVSVKFDGMPDTRWWSFEDSKTNFGDINPGTTDLGKLLFIEFAMVYANDWFLLPFTLDAGSIARIKGMTVTNVFGERYWIDAAGRGLDDEWNKWSMFTLNTKGNRGEQTDKSLLVLPTTPKIQEGKPLEEVHLIRDEMANMVWGIEHQVQLPTGKSKSGSEAGSELKGRYQKLLDDALASGTIALLQPDYKAGFRYEVMNSVPEQWIPFIPVQAPGGNRAIQLQRAAMPRILKNDNRPLEKVRPRTNILREGLQNGRAYFINEEEVPRAGANVYQSYQRCRWYDGRVFTWLGVRKQTGRGEGSSRLAFDQVKEVRK
jgi:hypothetical protein